MKVELSCSNKYMREVISVNSVSYAANESYYLKNRFQRPQKTT